MKKTYPLASTSHKLPRVIELIKSDVRKYIKRERRKKLPKGADFWDFDCRVGADSETAASVHIAEITSPHFSCSLLLRLAAARADCVALDFPFGSVFTQPCAKTCVRLVSTGLAASRDEFA